MARDPHPPLLELTRDGRAESVHRGAVALVDAAGRGRGIGDVEHPVWLRSCAKPLQAAALLALGVGDAFDLDDREVALLCASHNGEEEQVEIVRGMLRRGGFDESALRCATHRPLSPAVERALARAGREPTPLHHNCSGKHAGMLLGARLLDEDPARYLDDDSAVQRAVLRGVAAALGVEPEAIATATDGCSAPTFSVPLSRLALGFARLADPARAPEELAAPLRRVRAAMAAYPRLFGGRDRFDTDLTATTGGALVAKIGAEGLLGVAWPARATGLAVKIADGAARGYERLVPTLLREIGALDEDALAALARWADPVLKNHAGLAVGRVRPLVSLAPRPGQAPVGTAPGPAEPEGREP